MHARATGAMVRGGGTKKEETREMLVSDLFHVKYEHVTPRTLAASRTRDARIGRHTPPIRDAFHRGVSRHDRSRGSRLVAKRPRG